MTKVKKSPRRSLRPTRSMPRCRLHREFLRWLKLNRARFAVGIRLGRRTDEVLAFSFIGINPAITVYLSTSDVNVSVDFKDEDFDDENWDTLIWLFYSAKPVPGGYVCSECKPKYKRVFPNLVALWTDHLFEALLKWVNEALAPANWLILEGRVHGSTLARLTRLPPDTPVKSDCVRHVLPLRMQPRKQADTSANTTAPQP